MIKFESNLEEAYWERIHLFLKISVQNDILLEEPHFYLLNDKKIVESEFVLVGILDKGYLVTLNITNSGINRCIDNGTYTVLIIDNSYFSEVCFTGNTTRLSEWGRSFLYWNNTGNYTVSFMLDEYSNEPNLQILFSNMVMRAMENISVRSVSYVSKRDSFLVCVYNKLKSKKKPIFRKISKILFDILNRGFASEKRIVFLSEQDDKLSFNMKSIYKRLFRRGLDKNFDILLSLHKATSNRTILGTLKMILYTAISKTIIVDDHIPMFDWFLLPEDKKVIQVWHAGAGFKGVGYSRWGHCGCPGPFSCHRQYTYSISASEKISHFFSEQFGILDEQVIPTGMPRMDEFINENNKVIVISKLRQEYPQFVGKKVVLFAPTYRGQNRKNAYYPYAKIDFKNLYYYCKENNAVVLFKMHPWVKEGIPIDSSYEEYFFDFNAYPNINDLFYITDVLITDYSSSIFEFLLMKKPMLFFAFDKEQYSNSRGFHRDYDSNVPGKICETFEEIISALENNDFESYKINSFVEEYFEHLDDKSTDRVIDWLILDNLPDEYKCKLCDVKENNRKIREKSFAELLKCET